MGTRHLTCVVLDKKIRVAQYGQWNGYYEGQGETVVKFIEKRLLSPFGLSKFKKRIDKCAWITEADRKARWIEAGADADSDLVTMQVSQKHSELYPESSRDTGADVLDLIYKSTEGLKLTDSSDFAADSLFCEFAYVLDLDNETLEVYRGFNTKPVPKSNRFSKIKFPEDRDTEYYHVRLVKKFHFTQAKSGLKSLIEKEKEE